MLRAATAASGGTGAPDWTYCSIWPWHGAHERLDLDALGLRVGEDLDSRRDVGIALLEGDQAQALLTLDDGTHGAVLGLHDLGDLGERADGVQLVGLVDVLALRLALRDQRDERMPRHGRGRAP